MPDENTEERPNTLTDTQLVATALEDPPEGFGQIIHRYKYAVFGISLARIRNFHDAEDVSQQVFVEAYQRLHDLKDPARLGPWLRTTAITRSLNHLRRNRSTADLDAVPEPEDQRARPDEDIERHELRRDLLVSIGKLSKKQRETVSLYYIDGYRIRELAAIQEVPEGTIKHRQHEARNRLRQDMMAMVEDNLKSEGPDEGLADRVLALLSDPEEGKMWRSSTGAQLEIAGEKSREGFIRAMAFPNWKTRMRTLFWLLQYNRWNLEVEFAVDLMVKALDDSNRRVRQNALMSLSTLSRRLGDRSFVPQLVEKLEDPARHVRYALAKALAREPENVPLGPVLKATVRETHPATLVKFQVLIGRILDTQNLKL